MGDPLSLYEPRRGAIVRLSVELENGEIFADSVPIQHGIDRNDLPAYFDTIFNDRFDAQGKIAHMGLITSVKNLLLGLE